MKRVNEENRVIFLERNRARDEGRDNWGGEEREERGKEGRERSSERRIRERKGSRNREER